MKVIIVSTRYFGDCLLSAALSVAIKSEIPDALVDILTFCGNETILENISSIDHVITMPKNLSVLGIIKKFIHKRNYYDWALITQTSDRALFPGFWVSKKQCTILRLRNHLSDFKFGLLSHPISSVQGHWLDLQSLLLQPLLGHSVFVDPVAPSNPSLPMKVSSFVNKGEYVDCHPFSRYKDRNWGDEKWRTLFSFFIEKKFNIVLTGGPAKDERQRIDRLTAGFDTQRILNASGLLTFGQCRNVIDKTRLYIGVDTATSHIAAATGVDCICLFGPTDVITWGPSPKQRKPYSEKLAVQQNGNVIIVRNPNFLNCHLCTRHRCFINHNNPLEAICMQTLSSQTVCQIVDSLFKKSDPKFK